jgi:hypothetical protein
LPKAYNVLASPINKIILVVRLGRKSHLIRRPSANPDRWLQLDMRLATIIKTMVVLTLSSKCTNENPSKVESTVRQEEVVTRIQIHLYPAFNNSSIIFINQSSNTVDFRVDTTIHYKQGQAFPFSISLDSFKSNTLIDSFYSRSFLESIKFTPEKAGVMDGLSIYTVIERGNTTDTINSGNVYPKSLSKNIISQVEYIYKNTKDRSLKTYIEDLKSYFY